MFYIDLDTVLGDHHRLKRKYIAFFQWSFGGGIPAYTHP